MGTPVICPHCNSFFVSDNEPGNPFALCPHCGRWMNIAPVISRQRRKQAGPAKCPFCGERMAPGSDTCLHCKRQVITGEKLPLLRRLALMPTSRKMIVLCSALGAVILVAIVVNLIVTHLRVSKGPSGGPAGAFDPANVIAARELLAELDKADDEAKQVGLGAELGKVGPAAVSVILEKMADAELKPGVRRGLIIALGQIGDPRGADVVAEAMHDRRLRHTAMISLALIGDARAAKPIVEHFADQFRHATLLGALAKRSLVPTELDVAVLQRTWAERVAQLHKPIAAIGKPVLPLLLNAYWPAWQWPTRDRGSEWLDEVNRILGQMTLEGGTVNDALAGLLTDQPPDVRLAAALLLSRRRAGGPKAAEQWAAKIADLLANERLAVRQRAVWTIASITGKSFGRFGSDKPPAVVPAAALTEASEWVRVRTGRQVSIDAALLKAHERRPLVQRRTYHPARAEARRLIDGLARADWPTARARWRKLATLPDDAAPAVRTLLEGDVRTLDVPARLIVLELLAQWRDRESARLMDRLTGILDSPDWMSVCVAIAKVSASRSARVERWINQVGEMDLAVLAGTEPDKDFVPADIGRLIAPQGLDALAAIHRDRRFQDTNSALNRVYTATLDAMIAYGWPVSLWLGELGGR